MRKLALIATISLSMAFCSILYAHTIGFKKDIEVGIIKKDGMRLSGILKEFHDATGIIIPEPNDRNIEPIPPEFEAFPKSLTVKPQEPPKLPQPVLKLSQTKVTKGIKCIDSEGEAAIINNDIPSAKAEAIARAKWNAIEQVAGVQVRAQTVVQNMALVDDMVTKQIKGLVTGYTLKKGWQEDGVYKVIANVCIETSLADDAASMLGLNNSIAVFIPARKPRLVSETEERQIKGTGKRETYGFKTEDEYEESNILSETIIGRLTEKGLTVIDIAPGNITEARQVEDAIRSGNYLILKSYMYQYLSNILLIGKVDYTISTKKGQDIGYGISMPFNNVTTRLTYRIVARDPETGRIRVLAAGEEEGKGLAPNIEDAAARSMKDLAEKFTPVVFDKLSQYIQGITKRVRIRVLDIKDTGTSFAIKEIIQNTAWVTEVEEKGLGEFMIAYPENTVYLANSLSQKGFEVVDFSNYSLTLRYRGL
ncbi:MAG: hypothetical protein N2257_03860 [Thermodesulfovibrionales bacterium]|nr:hypothetical protein [Thermodesulfovibrionales bacterium]